MTDRPGDGSQALQQALALHQQGRRDEALAIYQRAIAAGDRTPALLANCAALLRQQGRHGDAIKLLERAVELAPAEAQIWYNLGNARSALDRSDGALSAWEKAIRLVPGFFAAHFNRARHLASQNELRLAAQGYRDALAIEPEHAQTWSNLGSVERRRGQPDAAETCHRKALRFASPTQAPGFWVNLGNARRDAGNPDEARECYRRALALAPDFEPAHQGLLATTTSDEQRAALQSELGTSLGYWHALTGMGTEDGKGDQHLATLDLGIQRFPEDARLRLSRGRLHFAAGRHRQAADDLAIATDTDNPAARAIGTLAAAKHQLGRREEAEALFRRALTIAPEDGEILANFGYALSRGAQHADAIALLRRAVALSPANAQATQQLAATLIDVGKSREAERVARDGLVHAPDRRALRRCLAHALVQQARIREARAIMSGILADGPSEPLDVGNAAFASLYDETLDGEALRAHHEAMCDRIAQPQSRISLRRRTEQHPLRVGLISDDLRDHPVGQLMRPVIEHLDKRRFEIVMYSSTTTPDDVTKQLRHCAHRWHDVVGLNNEELLHEVREARLDLLLDLGGHTSGNRLAVFKGRGAPVQATWLGYPATTGLSSMDYLIGDAIGTPQEMQPIYTERLATLPTFAFGWARHPDAPPPSPPPCRSNGHVTFGCWNNIAKWSNRSIELWSRVLHEVPNSRLSLRASALTDEDNHRQTEARFATWDIPPDRLDLLGPLRPAAAFLDAFGDIDIMLDPTPYNGGATSLSGLWQGVPMVTLAGDMLMSRMGASLLGHLALDHLVADSEDAYVAIATELAADPDKLDDLRRELPRRMSQLPHADPGTFAAAFGELLATIARQPQGACTMSLRENKG